MSKDPEEHVYRKHTKLIQNFDVHIDRCCFVLVLQPEDEAQP